MGRSSATTITGPEQVLVHTEDDDIERHRDRCWILFWVLVPTSERGVASGVPLSVTATVTGAHVSRTPLFVGEPATVSYADCAVVRPLPLEDELARRARCAVPQDRRSAIVAEDQD